MIPCTTFVWFFSSVVHLTFFLLFFIKQKRYVNQTHILKVKIKTPKEEWKLKRNLESKFGLVSSRVSLTSCGEGLYSYLDFPSQINYSLRSVSASVIKPSLSRTKSFKNTFFLYCINEWNNLTIEIRNSKSVSAFKKLIKGEKKTTQYSQSMIHLVLNSLPALDFNSVI